MDLVPEIKIIVHREGESAESAAEPIEPEKAEKAEKPKKSGGRKAKEEIAAEAPAVTAE